MRKYQQVVLWVLAFMSIIGLLLYRKQYVELRSTFENFNIFGEYGKVPGCLVLNETLKVDNIKYSYPIPSWINLQDGFHVYSAFWKGNGVSKAVGIGPKGSVPVFDCHIWHDYRDALFSNIGSFNFNEIEVQNSSFNVFEFSCNIESVKVKGSPYMFVFVKNKEKHFIPIVGKKIKKVDDISLCVYPDYIGIDKLSIVEFIGYHQGIGFTDFIIYDQIHYGLLNKVKEIISSLHLLKSLEILPWQFPLNVNDPVAKIAIDVDCIHRVSDKVSFIAVVNFEDYIVLKSFKKVNNLINTTDTAILNFRYQTCCIDFKNDRLSENSWPLLLRKTYCAPNNESKLVINNPKHDTTKIISMYSSVVINSYKLCSKLEHSKMIYDSTTRKFLGDLLQNKIILLWYSGIFF